MNRGLIAALAVLGVGLGVAAGWMLMPDTGGKIRDRQGISLDQPGFVPANEGPGTTAAAPEPGGSPREPAANGTASSLTPEQRAEIKAKLNTPEANAARLASAGWAQVRRDLSKFSGDADAQALLKSLDDVDAGLREVRRAAPTADWATAEARQRELIAAIKDSPYAADATSGLQTVEQRLQQYRDGTLPVSGPAASGDPGQPGAGGFDGQADRVRPR